MTLLLTPAAILLGCAALATRPPATIGGLVVSLSVGVVGALGQVPVAGEVRPDVRRWLAVAGFGTGVFALARALERPLVPHAGAGAIAAVVAVSVAEELFFRRLVYGWLVRWGAALAITGAAVLFALVHVPAYGAHVLPLDLAAGLFFGWQRWATGGWTAATVTHAAANTLQLL